MSDDKTDEGYNEFIKEYGLRENWYNENWDEWNDWDDLFCMIKTYWKTKTIRRWREKILKQFVYNLPAVRNPTALFDVFIQSDTFYLPQILSLIELHDTIHLLWKIGTIDEDEIKVGDNADEIDKFRYGLLHQGENSITEYYSKLIRCNNTVNLCKDHLEEKFFIGLSPKYMPILFDFNPIPPHDEFIKILIQRQNNV
ncbi:hypothetical protein Glove_575g28 [Diversispora epigaea]|uniref:Uncharacterized protein n=1 Tax=Diversispora epigaea TaxID=1348612 RepID=A0A397GAZ1_9GLOM|nr:hypothetical protein Glove_575g28 [Diversispora epigaea]